MIFAPVPSDVRNAERGDELIPSCATAIALPTPLACVAHAGVLSVWQTLQAFGIFRDSVFAGVTKWKVWLQTFTSPRVCAILGMWQPTHSLPGLPGLWWVCCSIVRARGPFGDWGLWQSRQSVVAGFRSRALLSEPWRRPRNKPVKTVRTPRRLVRKRKFFQRDRNFGVGICVR